MHVGGNVTAKALNVSEEHGDAEVVTTGKTSIATVAGNLLLHLVAKGADVTSAAIEQAKQRVRDEFPFDGYMDGGVESYDTIAETVTRFLSPGSKILDFGSGPCDKTAVLQELGYSCSAIDDLSDDWHARAGNRKRILEFINRMGIDFRRAGCDPIDFKYGYFDMVMMHDVIEHLHNSPRELLNDLLQLLKPGGLLFITVPNAANLRKRLALLVGRTNYPRFGTYYWYPDPWRGHVREYVRGDLIDLARFLDLKVVDLRSCNHMVSVLPRLLRPAYLACTAVFRGCRDTWLMVAEKPFRWEPRRALPEDEYQALMKGVIPTAERGV